MKNFDDLLTIQEAMDLAGVSRTTLYRWMKEGELAYIQKGSTRFFKRDVLLRTSKRMAKVKGSAKKRRGFSSEE